MHWNKEEEDYLRFAFSTQSYAKIAKKLHRSYSSVKCKAHSMDIKRKPATHRCEWSKEEIEYLKNAYRHYNQATIAKTLGRSTNSIRMASSRYIEDHERIDGLSMKSIAKAFHTDISVVKKWYEKHGMSARKRKFGKGIYYEIDGETFWIWAKKHTDIVSINKYERYSILPEPDDLYSFKWKTDPVENCELPHPVKGCGFD